MMMNGLKGEYRESRRGRKSIDQLQIAQFKNIYNSFDILL